ncbi:tRNA (adenosine(37)-N6)-threonylcarbamoyltransferase complex transferase subunit TsaD [Taylorella equigenitalis]|uniref:tRNA N6-adenosine threonylcarbamoyltransferase n=3 Tax=Taylorella equigenitalis TaxID=29575 RepID=A0A654KJ15_TAYEM|nr:tRNA (adenosine(37)-N6)-threonylcarbamoyltransferase complex transferase subunit TsaD [Taylorella equigenitalis]ADU92468.1 YgjD/Kae1/Qri7 family [Taylorella equigenitalis MCE9]AFN36018.1 putative O-sialoglycoprotein endopeptidase [Taylorella equigenitalis ATCC 35865]ASY30650.1 tRNA (adenosine(37)-N6)-threonylcarbamoyltransferase complex transferase subunit TsaD [Taylorella equigenitalis]ASY37957.1 tRNA (adenosine(37)-N6)-threonylcarbamoyltransferase complex transferase subunit TsaD [Taylorel
MLVLGIESSCDETGLALVDTELGLLGHTLHSQISMHGEYGGVVPELASRDHIKNLLPLLDELLFNTNKTLDDVDVIAYTAGPGLQGALLVASSFAHGLAWSRGLPLVPVHHLEGHLLSPLLSEPKPEFPFIALLVSGGHTQIMLVERVGYYKLLGETLDDAAGEAFDKTAKILGLPYPGGAHLARLAINGDSNAFALPRPMKHSGDLNFSFSGLKTAVMNQYKKLELTEHDEISLSNLAASTQEAIVDVLGFKVMQALKETGIHTLVVAGGVGANLKLRGFLKNECEKIQAKVYFPPMEFCTDNGAMIAHAASERIKAGLVKLEKKYDQPVRANWSLESVNAFY